MNDFISQIDDESGQHRYVSRRPFIENGTQGLKR